MRIKNYNSFNENDASPLDTELAKFKKTLDTYCVQRKEEPATQKRAEELLDEMKKIRDEKIPETELRKAKDYLIGNMYLGLESSDDLANFFGSQEILREKIKTPEEIEKQIEKITAADIAKVAKEIIRNDKLNMAVIGKYKDDSKFKDYFKI